jgi:hypothetical protein
VCGGHKAEGSGRTLRYRAGIENSDEPAGDNPASQSHLPRGQHPRKCEWSLAGDSGASNELPGMKSRSIPKVNVCNVQLRMIGTIIVERVEMFVTSWEDVRWQAPRLRLS